MKNLFKRKEKAYDYELTAENYIGNTSARQIEIRDKWLSENKPKYKIGDKIHIESNYGSDHWGAWVEYEPDGNYEIIGILKINVPHLPKCHRTPDIYKYHYVIKKENGDYNSLEIAREDDYYQIICTASDN